MASFSKITFIPGCQVDITIVKMSLMACSKYWLSAGPFPWRSEFLSLEIKYQGFFFSLIILQLLPDVVIDRRSGFRCLLTQDLSQTQLGSNPMSATYEKATKLLCGHWLPHKWSRDNHWCLSEFNKVCRMEPDLEEAHS